MSYWAMKENRRNNNNINSNNRPTINTDLAYIFRVAQRTDLTQLHLQHNNKPSYIILYVAFRIKCSCNKHDAHCL